MEKNGKKKKDTKKCIDVSYDEYGNRIKKTKKRKSEKTKLLEEKMIAGEISYIDTLYADFETTTAAYSNTKTKIYAWGLKAAVDGIFSYGIDMQSFFDMLKTYPKLKKVFFHNLVKFDGNFIYKWMLSNGYIWRECKADELFAKQFSWLMSDDGRLYQMTVRLDNDQLVIFECTLTKLMTSVKKLGKSLGLDMEKEELDYNAYKGFKHIGEMERDSKLMSYLEKDIDIVISAVKRIEEYDIKFKLTASSTSLNHFKEFYGELKFIDDFGGYIYKKGEGRTPYNVLSIDDWEFVNTSYQGGYVYWPQKNTNKVIEGFNGISYDINSLYPYAMQDFKLPYGEILDTKPFGDYVELVNVLIVSAKLKDDRFPPIIKDLKTGRYGEPKYLKECYSENRTYWAEEFELIKKLYDIEYVQLKSKFFRSKFIFQDWVREVSQNKINAPDDVLRNFWKLIQNSLYGKTGQHYKTGKRIIYEDGMRVKDYDNEGVAYSWINSNGEIVYNCPWAKNLQRYGKWKEYRHKTAFDINEVRSYNPIASRITHIARMTLFDAILKNLDIWLYSDTDSCYFSDDPIGIEIHDSKYGAWKPEYKFNKFKVLRAKGYMYYATEEYKNGWKEANKDIKKISGITESGKKNITWDNFHLGSVIKDGKLGMKNVDGGIILLNSDFKLGKECVNQIDNEINLLKGDK